ncbi:MAG: hypothetical protein WBC63_08455 [Candidatus Bipolaricaulia bacterium]
MVARGVTNRAQHWTVGHYTEEFTRGESEGVIRSLHKSGSWLIEPPEERG